VVAGSSVPSKYGGTGGDALATLSLPDVVKFTFQMTEFALSPVPPQLIAKVCDEFPGRLPPPAALPEYAVKGIVPLAQVVTSGLQHV
jgi:hypothetical protein